MFLNLLRCVNIIFACRQLKLSVVIKKIGIKILEKFAYFHSKVKKKICVLRGYSTSEINEGIFR